MSWSWARFRGAETQREVKRWGRKYKRECRKWARLMGHKIYACCIWPNYRGTCIPRTCMHQVCTDPLDVQRSWPRHRADRHQFFHCGISRDGIFCDAPVCFRCHLQIQLENILLYRPATISIRKEVEP